MIYSVHRPIKHGITWLVTAWVTVRLVRVRSIAVAAPRAALLMVTFACEWNMMASVCHRRLAFHRDKKGLTTPIIGVVPLLRGKILVR